jgi:4-hydroxy-tetrahydrodipicolinate reductase
MSMKTVAVVGATGRMGQLAIELINDDPNYKLHAALNSQSQLSEILGADLVLDFTLPEVSTTVVQFAISNDLKIVVGTSGWSENKLAGLTKELKAHPDAAVVVIPNFSIGSMLGQQFAALAAKYFDSIEIVEVHHAGKVDSPSGTAVRTAEQIGKTRRELPQPLIPGVDQPARGQVVSGVPIHSLRLKGVSAKQDVIFGGSDETLTISHDVSSHRAYSQGILLAMNFALGAKGLTIGLDQVVGL